jgi:hypothetical protein
MFAMHYPPKIKISGAMMRINCLHGNTIFFWYKAERSVRSIFHATPDTPRGRCGTASFVQGDSSLKAVPFI